ncbi:hypothetical protein ABPG77_001056 [Micractinium sp. CCAP 211/92]
MSANNRQCASAAVDAEQQMGPVERAVEGITSTAAAAASKLLEAVPGTAEHQLKKELEEKGDVSVDTGAPLPGRRQQQPSDEIMRHTVQATAPGLTAVHPPRPDAQEVKVPDLRTADDLAFTGKHQHGRSASSIPLFEGPDFQTPSVVAAPAFPRPTSPERSASRQRNCRVLPGTAERPCRCDDGPTPPPRRGSRGALGIGGPTKAAGAGAAPMLGRVNSGSSGARMQQQLLPGSAEGTVAMKADGHRATVTLGSTGISITYDITHCCIPSSRSEHGAYPTRSWGRRAGAFGTSLACRQHQHISSHCSCSPLMRAKRLLS